MANTETNRYLALGDALHTYPARCGGAQGGGDGVILGEADRWALADDLRGCDDCGANTTGGITMANETIELTNVLETGAQACERHEGWPLHAANECERLAGVRPYTRDVRCSICDQEWDERVAVSQHLGCRSLPSGRPASPLISYRKGEGWVEIVSAD